MLLASWILDLYLAAPLRLGLRSYIFDRLFGLVLARYPVPVVMPILLLLAAIFGAVTFLGDQFGARITGTFVSIGAKKKS